MEKKIYLTILFAFVIVLGIWYLNNFVAVDVFDTEAQEEYEEYVPEPCMAYITGEVINPAVYEYEGVLRFKDLIEIAGGPTEIADLETINLAEFIVDGEHYVVPPKSDAKILESKGGLININEASVFELTVLPKIGEATAKSIVEYRISHGPFVKVSDIKNVPGIGDGIFEEIRQKICVN